MTVGTTNFPGSLDSHTSASPLGFGEVNNQAYTLSTASHTAAVTTITVASTSKFPSKGYLVVKRELISYTGTTATTFTGCTRGVGGTTAAAFLSGTLVEQVVTAANHNDLAAAIVAVETKIGTSSSTPSTGTVLRGTGTGASAWGQVASADIAANAVTATRATIIPTAGQTTTSTSLVAMTSGSVSFTTSAQLGVIYLFGRMRLSSSAASGNIAVYLYKDGVIHQELIVQNLAANNVAQAGVAVPLTMTGVAASTTYTFALYWSGPTGTTTFGDGSITIQEFKR